MKTIIITLFVAFSFSIKAQHSYLEAVDTAQSSSSLDWNSVENSSTEVIYPNFLTTQATEIANLVEHYSHVVGQNYGITKPEKFPLILRPEVSALNGFVTLGPRRSEWYDNATIAPFIGGLNFYQALSIHEYRHVIQYDFMNQSTNKFVYALFGDTGLSVALYLGLPAWYFEGDAVWAETYYTDAGRGRSPRFAARLKAMVLNDQAPTYDEFMGRTYNTNHPNHYVFGYYLVTAAYEKFGINFWPQVLSRIAKFSFNPYAITNAFAAVSGVEFEDFYASVMRDLKKRWHDPSFKKNDHEYQQIVYPMIDQDKIYYLKSNLNQYWNLYQHGNSESLAQLPIAPSISRVSLKNGKLAYTQFVPSLRFGFKDYSNLYVYDLNSKERHDLITDERIYHPQFSPDGSKIAAIQFTKENMWKLVVVDLKGNELQRIGFKNEIITEAAWKNDSTVYALLQRQDGYKKIVEIDLKSKKTQSLTDYTRANLFALTYQNNQLYFESDYKGTVQILSINTSNRGLQKCSDEIIAAYHPAINNQQIVYVSEVANGHEIVNQKISCISIPKDTLSNFAYLGNTPSDNYAKAPITTIANYEKLITKPHVEQEYSEFSGGLAPHSWNLISGRGFEAAIFGDNYLNTFSYALGVGRDSEEKQPFAYADLFYKKYFPIFGLHLDYSKREDELNGTSIISNWEETEGSLSMTLPFTFKSGFYNTYIGLTGQYGLIKYTKRRFYNVYEPNDELLLVPGGEFTFSVYKDLRFREIYPSVGLKYSSVYKKANAEDVKSFSSEVFFQSLDLYLPTFFNNHGFKIALAMEKQSKGYFNYRFDPINDGYTSYVYSRGFNYFYSDLYEKVSANYLLPLAYPDLDFWGWAFLRRMYATIFYDHTTAELLGRNYSLNSTGMELVFESNLLRKFDVNLGVRGSHKIDQEEQEYDFFLSLGAGF